MVVIVACGKSKVDAPTAPIGRLYKGGYFMDCRNWAESVAPGEWLILSAKHDLRRQDDVVETYDLKMGQPGSVTADTVRAQAEALGIIDETDVLLIGGQLYATLLAEVWPTVRAPFYQFGSFGDQRKALQFHRGRVPEHVHDH